ncbi:F0F1 ATP synthase subunit B [Eisenibacter elegans]|jgi:F-type H+-transporting ATPase subunit b|uniref:F0F1 ATP synthase subunit B n=1 Tax=Eisenibacter elegans TaxID=997 RepID=UPI0003FF21B3|nr:F0F1 ATP synthase subunit B [Eisenibacter elegans]
MNLVTPDLGLFFWALLTFSLVFFVLSRVAWKPIMQALKERETSIEQALASAEKARQEMAKLTADNEKLLDEARIERDRILKTAQKAADELREAEKERTTKEVAKMLDDARRVIQSEKQQAVNEIKAQISVLSVDIAEKLLRQQLADKNAQQALAQQMVNDLKIN